MIAYILYILKHKFYVWLMCFRMWLYRQWLTHDLSKFLTSEFIPYYKRFQLKQNNNDFNYAWMSHYRRNKHHRQHRVEIIDWWSLVPQDMPEKYIKEMLCDWRWFGRSFTKLDNWLEDWSEVRSYYAKRWYWMILSHKTREYIEIFLNNSQ